MKSFISSISSKISFKKAGELLLFSLFIGAVNIIFSKNPGFFKGFFNPYLYLSLIIAAYYGKYYGFLSIVFSCIIIFLPLPLILNLFYPGTWSVQYWKNFESSYLITLAAALIGVYIFGMIRDSFISQVKQTKTRIKKISRDKGLISRQCRALKKVNREIEERISRQQDSVTALYSRIQELYSLNFSKALEVILEIVRKFSGAVSASIWELDPETKSLRLAASIGWQSADKKQTVLPVDTSIEGWVVRNSIMFSVNMLLQYENLRKMDSGRNLLTIPLYAGRKIWGALNIEDMPFIKYNHYTEKLLLMTSALASPALEKALEYESVIKQAEVNTYTGFPPYSQFYSLLQKTMRRMTLEKGTLSVLIMELINFDSLVQQHGRENVFPVIVSITEELRRLSQNRAVFFHYKDENQIVLLCPNLDFDGTSLMSLETLGMINEKEWRIKNQEISLDVILGYAAMGEKEMTPEEILQVAENILEMQKV